MIDQRALAQKKFPTTMSILEVPDAARIVGDPDLGRAIFFCQPTTNPDQFQEIGKLANFFFFF